MWEFPKINILRRWLRILKKWEQMDHAVDEIRSQCFEYKIF